MSLLTKINHILEAYLNSALALSLQSRTTIHALIGHKVVSNSYLTCTEREK
jgi:hypothetical protein